MLLKKIYRYTDSLRKFFTVHNPANRFSPERHSGINGHIIIILIFIIIISSYLGKLWNDLLIIIKWSTAFLYSKTLRHKWSSYYTINAVLISENHVFVGAQFLVMLLKLYDL